jgi:hypothetical protein
MRYASLPELLNAKATQLARGPLSIVMAEDEVEIDSTLAHQIKCGFRDVVLLAPEGVRLAPEHENAVHIVTHDVFVEGALPDAVNQVMDAVAGAWVHYCYNAEYLFFPFCETRRIRELLTFHTEERREAMLTYVIDLYAGDLGQHANAVSLTDAWLDKSGYYALASLISSAACAGGSRSTSPSPAARSTAFHFSVPNPACGCAPTSR